MTRMTHPAAPNAKPRVLAIVQARTLSSRLPGKVLMPLAGRPLICFLLERVRRARRVDQIVLATSIDASDDVLAETVAGIGVDVHRGPLDDVLGRFAGAAAGRDADVIVRLTGDCPLIDAALIDRIVEHLQANALDYVTNSEPPSYPDGLDVEAFSVAALHRADHQARLASEREHVTPWMRTAAAALRTGCVASAVDLSMLRWTVDHADDLAVVRSLVDALTPTQALDADLFDWLRVLDAEPRRLREANRHARNEGYQKSLLQDALAAAAP